MKYVQSHVKIESNIIDIKVGNSVSKHHLKLLVLFLYVLILFICRYGLMVIDDQITILLLIAGFVGIALLNKNI